jgi:hypothetical protein
LEEDIVFKVVEENSRHSGNILYIFAARRGTATTTSAAIATATSAATATAAGGGSSSEKQNMRKWLKIQVQAFPILLCPLKIINEILV